MSLQLLAKQMESKGRKGDSMLVHMTAKEADALQKMAESAGGSLSVNPETGLLEANFLKKMLPTLVGIGVGMFAGPMAGAAAGAAVGGYQAKRNDQDVGMGMLMGGLGGYGGAGIGAGLGTAGAASVGQTAGNLAGPVGAGEFGLAANQAVAAQSPLQLMGQGAKGLLTDPGRASFMQGMGGLGGLAQTAGMAAAPMMAPDRFAPEEEADTDMPVYDYEMNPTGASTTGSGEVRHFNPRFVRRAADGGVMANESQRFAAGGQVNLQGTFTAEDQSGGGQFGQANANGHAQAVGGPLPGFSSSFGQMGSGGQMGGFDPRAVQADPQGFSQMLAQMRQREQQIPGSTMMGDMRYRPERDDARIAANQAGSNAAFYAAGGMASLAQGGAANLPDGAFVVPARITSELGNGSTNAGAQRLQAMEQRLLGRNAQPVNLGRYSGGGNLVRGAGDGVSDSVPATIGGRQPARIADGEYIFSEKATKAMGNGSTEAGARQFYAMMDRVQKARKKSIGKDRVAVNSRSEKLLPA